MNRPHTLGSRLATLALRLTGWKPVLAPPPGPKFVAAVAPHTSNADFWPGIAWRWATRAPVHWVAKRELFRPPLGPLLRAWGGLPVDRARVGGNFVDAVVAVIQREREIVLAVAPEGTRARGEHWKTGFYHMAVDAGVPIGVTVFDWKRKQVGVIGYVEPSGDIEADFARIRELLQDVRGHTPANETPAWPRPAGEPTAGRLPPRR
ncbi:1-acyl-sn-glycerol-3-phosphate acyltransferase [Deinococcus hopiensis KR-140]|uniref:1-acyl-sn-glycerol-3-phosphate acyltransferase n=2 Tax=Deinococcus TaxID=1298 RepID=A0A1W1VQU4_9DEIO|nr:lysophospholipid acyltransferase family protein [Deinococcus hopiensis]SMB95717.1 1-acyl-sn-glycerol-3-phosphate acyltransferase [Deinococcus hopiensis KR-140]